MKNYCCEKCGSINVSIDDRGTQKALMCGDCGVWLKWIGKKELPLIEKYIKENSDISTKENVFSETLIEKYGWELAIWSVLNIIYKI